jgi:hypothetical protein
MKGGKLVLAAAFVVFMVLFLAASASAQQKDGDSDGVLDNVDKCAETNPEEGLPTVTQNQEYVGCSCSQIELLLPDRNCYDFFCEAGRPLSVQERVLSSRKSFCDTDYCINTTFYAFPRVNQVRCVNGKEESFNCTPAITESSKLCMDQAVPQKREAYTGSQPEVKQALDNWEKLLRRVYDLTAREIVLRNGLGISGEERFGERVNQTMDSLSIEKSSIQETRSLGGVDKNVTMRTIRITPNRYMSFRKLYVFEEIPGGYGVEGKDVIPKQDVALQEESPVLLVWEVEKADKPFELSYQVNREFSGETNTLTIAREVRDRAWLWLLVPLAIIIIVIYAFINWSKKSEPRRTRIFKE